MKVYGADFSGARNPSRGIYYAEGSLSGHTLNLERVVHCDDRLDLLATIHFSKAPWGLDFPFSVPAEAYRLLKVKNWEELLKLAVEKGRTGFVQYLESSGLPGCEAKCRGGSICCRFTDAAVQAFSPFKNTNPNMRMMTYSGLKLLYYLRQLGHRVYPFDQYASGVSRLYEVYPSWGWRQVGLKRSKELLPLFAERFYERFGLKVKGLAECSMNATESADAADAVVACASLAFELAGGKLEPDWQQQPTWASGVEWLNRHKEGLVVKPGS
jgi:hypothetical protein